MGGQVEQCDFTSVAAWKLDVLSQQLRQRVGHRELVSIDHVGQQERCEDFADRADFEQALLVERGFVFPS